MGLFKLIKSLFGSNSSTVVNHEKPVHQEQSVVSNQNQQGVSMYTSIANLRDSAAQRDRVDSVERNLKKLNPQWDSNWYFPIVAVGLSNAADDVSWVASHSSVVLASSPKTLYVVGADKTITATQLNTKVRSATDNPADCRTTGKTTFVNDSLNKLNAALAEALAFPGYNWFDQPFTETQPAQKASPNLGTVTEIPSSSAVPLQESAEQAAVPTTSEIDPTVVKSFFEQAFSGEITDFAFATSPKHPNGKYVNDRTQGKFLGFTKALNLVKSGVIKLD